MLQLTSQPLSLECLAALADYQEEIDSLPDYPEQVQKASQIWPARRRNVPFREIEETLVQMTPGVRRCCYCEDSAAYEIEHIWPKSLYPEKTFVWENYLYACGPCNRPKINRFAIFHSANRNRLDLAHVQGKTPQPPPDGDPVLINPRVEDPLDFLWLDLKDTFEFFPLADEDSSEAWKRAEYTLDILALNSRAELSRDRKTAYTDFKLRLKEISEQKSKGVPQGRVEIMIDELQHHSHPTVWKEMIRYHQNGWLKKIDSDLEDLFLNTPEAVSW